MNKRIRELAEQADEYAKKYVAECKHYGYQMEYNEFQTRFEEKFAELILTEVCFDMINSHIDMSKVNRIAQHWGLEKFDEHS